MLFIQLPLWHICWVSWEREGTLVMSREGGRASRRKGQLVRGPRGSGTGSVLRRTEVEAGWGGRGPGQERKTLNVSVSILQLHRDSWYLLFSVGNRPITFLPSCLSQPLLCLFLPFLCPAISPMGDVLPHRPSGSSSPLSQACCRVYSCSHLVAGPSSLGDFNHSFKPPGPYYCAPYICTHGGGFW